MSALRSDSSTMLSSLGIASRKSIGRFGRNVHKHTPWQIENLDTLLDSRRWCRVAATLLWGLADEP